MSATLYINDRSIDYSENVTAIDLFHIAVAIIKSGGTEVLPIRMTRTEQEVTTDSVVCIVVTPTTRVRLETDGDLDAVLEEFSGRDLAAKYGVTIRSKRDGE